LRSAIRTGRLAAGERLPATRVLAGQLGVSRGLVVDAYAQLESEGYVESLIGSGTVVAAGVTTPGTSLVPPLKRRLDVDFEYGVPDLASFPTRDWSWSLSEACRTATVDDLGDEAGTGTSPLRTVLAGYLGRVRSASVDSDAVVVCQGFRHGLNIVLRALVDHGVDTVGLEDPGPVDHDAIAVRSGMTAVSVPVDDFGIDVDALAATGARAVVVTPAHQSPTGVLLAPERRHALVEWARRMDGYIIEDDYDAEFRYDRQPVGSLQGLAPDRVIGMGSVSKTLAPALHLGWIVSPPQLIGQIGVEKQLLGRGAPGIDQLALAMMIESGRFDRHLRHMRSVYGARRTTLVTAIAEHAAQVVVTGLAAGCHAVLRLPEGVDEQHVVDIAAQRSIGVSGMSRYRTTPDAGAPAELVIGFGAVTDGAIQRGIARPAPTLTSRPYQRIGPQFMRRIGSGRRSNRLLPLLVTRTTVKKEHHDMSPTTTHPVRRAAQRTSGQDELMLGYLRRLDQPAAPPSIEALSDLHRAHVERIPYETFWLHLREGLGITPRESLQRIVADRRGGYCFHLNGAFAELLDWLGYTVTRHSAGVHDAAGASPATIGNHLALTVHDLPDHANPGGRWYVDAGLGDALHAPLPLVPGVYQQGPTTFIIGAGDGVGDWSVGNDAAGSPATSTTRHRRSRTSLAPSPPNAATRPASTSSAAACSRRDPRRHRHTPSRPEPTGCRRSPTCSGFGSPHQPKRSIGCGPRCGPRTPSGSRVRQHRMMCWWRHEQDRVDRDGLPRWDLRRPR